MTSLNITFLLEGYDRQINIGLILVIRVKKVGIGRQAWGGERPVNSGTNSLGGNPVEMGAAAVRDCRKTVGGIGAATTEYIGDVDSKLLGGQDWIRQIWALPRK